MSQRWKRPKCRAVPICGSPGARTLPALCWEYKAWGSAYPGGHGTHNSLMRMSGTQMLSAGREICVRLSKRAGSHLRNSSVQCWGQGTVAWGVRSLLPASTLPWDTLFSATHGTIAATSAEKHRP